MSGLFVLKMAEAMAIMAQCKFALHEKTRKESAVSLGYHCDD
jgi:hypothetical protein